MRYTYSSLESQMGRLLLQLMVGTCLPQNSESRGVAGDLLFTAQDQKGADLNPRIFTG